MDFRSLRHFAAVFETGSLSKAATQVFISQPALTRSIHLLEESMGAALFERRPRGVVPTPAGLALYDHARLVLNECERARAEVRAVASGAQAELAVGIAAMFADHLVDAVVARFCSAGNATALRVREGFFEEMVEALRDARLDLVFSNVPDIPVSGDILIEPLQAVEAGVYVSGDSSFGRDGPVGRAVLAELNWALIDQPHMQDFLNRLFFGEHRLPPAGLLMRTNSLNLIRALVARGGFATLLPDHLMAKPVAEGNVRRVAIEGPPIVRQAALLRRAGAPRRAEVDRFCAILREVCTAAP